jgi:hypothetical protein
VVFFSHIKLPKKYPQIKVAALINKNNSSAFGNIQILMEFKLLHVISNFAKNKINNYNNKNNKKKT